MGREKKEKVLWPHTELFSLYRIEELGPTLVVRHVDGQKEDTHIRHRAENGRYHKVTNKKQIVRVVPPRRRSGRQQTTRQTCEINQYSHIQQSSNKKERKQLSKPKHNKKTKQKEAAAVCDTSSIDSSLVLCYPVCCLLPGQPCPGEDAPSNTKQTKQAHHLSNKASSGRRPEGGTAKKSNHVRSYICTKEQKAKARREQNVT